MNTQVKSFTEVTSFAEAMRSDKTDADAGDDDRKPESPERTAESIVTDYVDWLLTIAVSPDTEKNRRTKMAELLREFTAKIQPHAKLYAGKGADASKAATEAKVLKLAAECGLPAELLGKATLQAIVERVAGGDADYARRALADIVEVARRGGARNLQEPFDADAFVKQLTGN